MGLNIRDEKHSDLTPEEAAWEVFMSPSLEMLKQKLINSFLGCGGEY